MTKETKKVPVKNEADDDLVEKAYQNLSMIFSAHFENAMTDAGLYLLKTFYDNQIELARKKESPHEESLNQLIKRLQNRSANTPSKSWIYQSIGLIVQSHDIEKEENEFFQTYGKLSLSHKISLLPITNMGAKKELINAVVEEGLSVRDLESRKTELQASTEQAGLLTLLNNPDEMKKKKNFNLIQFENLSKMPYKKLQDIKKKAEEKRKEFNDKIKSNQSYLKQYDAYFSEINKALKGKAAGKVGRPAKSDKS